MRPASSWTMREYPNLSAGFAGDDMGKGKHCVLFLYSTSSAPSPTIGFADDDRPGRSLCIVPLLLSAWRARRLTTGFAGDERAMVNSAALFLSFLFGAPGLFPLALLAMTVLGWKLNN